MIDIAVHELNKYNGSNHILKGITLEIYGGEKVGLLGNVYLFHQAKKLRYSPKFPFSLKTTR